MENNYDLTTKEGFENAKNFLMINGWVISPIIPLFTWVIDKILSPEKSSEKQIEIARNLIIEGKKQGVKKMTVKVGHEAGINIGIPIENIPLKIKVGNSGDMEIEVEYK